MNTHESKTVIRSRPALAALACCLALALAGTGAHAGGLALDGHQAGVTAGSLAWQMIPPFTFVPRASDWEYSYASGGCIYHTGGSNAFMTHKLQVPQNAVIDAIRVFFYDDAPGSGANVRLWLTSYDGQGKWEDRSSVGSSDSGGYGSEWASASYAVDYSTPHASGESINLVVDLGSAGDSSLRFCGARIRFVEDDLIFHNGFQR